MAQFRCNDIDDMSKAYRTHFINSLSGFKSANLVGTQCAKRNTNLAIISSTFHLGADPSLMGFINRPHSVDRHTLENLMDTGYFTLNHVNPSIIEQAHQTSARYPREESEFSATGLQEHWVEGIDAPFVKESHVQIGLAYKEHHTLINQTVLVIAEVVYVNVPDHCIEPDGLINIETCESTVVSGLDNYHSTQKLKRLSYAKPHKELQVLES